MPKIETPDAVVIKVRVGARRCLLSARAMLRLLAMVPNKAKPATKRPVIAPDLKAIVNPDCKLCLEASAVLTFAFTEINIPT